MLFFQETEYRHKTPLQVRFVDIDKLGHVNNATLLSYIETARVAYFQYFIDKEDWFVKGTILARTIIDYKEPVYLDDNVYVYTQITKWGTKSFDISNVIVKMIDGKEVVCAYGMSVLVCVNYNNRQTTEIPEAWKEKQRAFEERLITSNA